MTKRTIESVVFRLEEGISKEHFLETVAGSTEFVRSQPGFVSRRLSCSDDGTWIEHIEWETLDHARSAAAAIWQAEVVQPFLKCISGPSITLRHAELQVAVG